MPRLTTLVLEFVLAAIGTLLLVQAVLFMKVGWMTVLDPSTTSFMREQQLALRAAGNQIPLRHDWVDYDRISRNLKRAVIASEDSNFVEHAGVDLDALERAYDRNQKRGKVVAGGSTITQQLAKNLFLTGSRNYLRKAEEFAITFMLEFWCSKQRILEIYLNVVEWGVGVFGADAASHHYFNIGADRLSPQQGARLAVMLPDPRGFDRNRGSPYLARRTNVILNRMGAAQVPEP